MTDQERIQSLFTFEFLRGKTIVELANGLFEATVKNHLATDLLSLQSDLRRITLDLNFDANSINQRLGKIECKISRNDSFNSHLFDAFAVESVPFSIFRGLLAHIAGRSKASDGGTVNPFRGEGWLVTIIDGRECEFLVRIENMAGQYSLTIKSDVKTSVTDSAIRGESYRHIAPVAATN